MLTGKMVRVRHARNRLVPMYLDPLSEAWLGVAEQLLFVYGDAAGRTRGEIDADLVDLVGEGPTQLVHQGLAKLLEDRCEFDATSELAPEVVREAAFRAGAAEHAAAGAENRPFRRQVALEVAARAVGATPEQAEVALFADLRDQQRVLHFPSMTPEQLLQRYNVALAQAVVLRAASLEVRVWGETPARFRQLFRAIKFHRLICQIAPADGKSYTLKLDGPLSLFTATQKYGMQLAQFLPALLHCKAFDLRGDIRWGSDKKPKTFTLAATDGLKSHAPDWGVFRPKELDIFRHNFAANVAGWTLSDDPHPLPLEGGTWVPDFTLTHDATGGAVFVEFLGYWRKLDLEPHLAKLRRAYAGRFVLVASEALRADEAAELAAGPELYRFKRTPVAADVAKAAGKVLGIGG